MKKKESRNPELIQGKLCPFKSISTKRFKIWKYQRYLHEKHLRHPLPSALCETSSRRELAREECCNWQPRCVWFAASSWSVFLGWAATRCRLYFWGCLCYFGYLNCLYLLSILFLQDWMLTSVLVLLHSRSQPLVELKIDLGRKRKVNNELEEFSRRVIYTSLDLLNILKSIFATFWKPSRSSAAPCKPSILRNTNLTTTLWFSPRS